MDRERVISKIKELRESSKERSFSQTVDLVANLQNLNLKLPDHRVETGVTLSTPLKPKNFKVCAVIDSSLKEAEEIFDKVIYKEDLESMKGDIEKIRAVTHSNDRFVVMSSLMPLFAQVLGKYLGPLNKMPSPKLGMVITPGTDLNQLYDKMQKSVHIQVKKSPLVQVPVGGEKESDEVLADNILAVYEALVSSLPQEKQNVRNIGIKFTMSKLVVL